MTNTPTGLLFYDRDGSVIDVDKYCEFLSDEEYRIIAQDSVGDLFISTVWLGHDHSYCDGPPIIFETIVFDAEKIPVEQCRYATIEEARKGHQLFIYAAKEGVIPETKDNENGEPECGQ